MDDGRRVLRVLTGDAQLAHIAPVPGADQLSVHAGADSTALFLMRLGHALPGLRRARRLDQAPADRVIRPALRQGGQLQQALAGRPGLWPHSPNLKFTAGQRSRLVKYHAARPGQGLYARRALEQHAARGRPAHAAEKAQRYRYHQRAGAAYNKKGQRALYIPRPAGVRAPCQVYERRQQRQKQRRRADSRRIYPRKAGYEALGPGLPLGGLLRQAQDAGDRALAEGLRRPYPQQACQADAAAGDLVPSRAGPGQALPREGGGVQRGLALYDDSVYRHALARPDHDDAARLHLLRLHRYYLTVPLQLGPVRTQVHERRNAAAAAAHGVLLKQRSQLVEHHDRYGFAHVAQRQRAYRRHGHEEILVEHAALQHAAQGAPEHIPTCNEIRQEQKQPPVQAFRYQI